MDARTIVLTGASSGIGRAAATALAEQGHRLAIVGRNPERTQQVADAVGGRAFLADFAHLRDVTQLADELLAAYDDIHVLVANAGGLVRTRTETDDGHELMFQANVLAAFLLIRRLLPRLAQSARPEAASRVLLTSSVANRAAPIDIDDLDARHSRWYGGWPQYGRTKLMDLLLAKALARRVDSLTVEAYSFHPGFIRSSFGDESPLVRFGRVVAPWAMGYPPEFGAEPLIMLASTVAVPAASGTYFDHLAPNGRVNRQINTPEREQVLSDRLWVALDRLAADVPAA